MLTKHSPIFFFPRQGFSSSAPVILDSIRNPLKGNLRCRAIVSRGNKIQGPRDTIARQRKISPSLMQNELCFQLLEFCIITHCFL